MHSSGQYTSDDESQNPAHHERRSPRKKPAFVVVVGWAMNPEIHKESTEPDGD